MFLFGCSAQSFVSADICCLVVFYILLLLLLPLLLSVQSVYVYFGYLVIVICSLGFLVLTLFRVLAYYPLPNDSVPSISDYLDSDLCLAHYTFCLVPIKVFSLHCASGSLPWLSPHRSLQKDLATLGPAPCFSIMSTTRSTCCLSGHAIWNLPTVTLFLCLSLHAPPVSLWGTFLCTLPVPSFLSPLFLSHPFLVPAWFSVPGITALGVGVRAVIPSPVGGPLCLSTGFPSITPFLPRDSPLVLPQPLTPQPAPAPYSQPVPAPYSPTTSGSVPILSRSSLGAKPVAFPPSSRGATPAVCPNFPGRLPPDLLDPDSAQRKGIQPGAAPSARGRLEGSN